MGDSLRIDVDQLRQQAREVAEMGEEAARMESRLTERLAQTDGCWGDDEAGQAFADYYVPDAGRAMENLRNLVEQERAFGRGIAEAADALEASDSAVGKQISGADADLPVETGGFPATQGRPVGSTRPGTERAVGPGQSPGPSGPGVDGASQPGAGPAAPAGPGNGQPGPSTPSDASSRRAPAAAQSGSPDRTVTAPPGQQRRPGQQRPPGSIPSSGDARSDVGGNRPRSPWSARPATARMSPPGIESAPQQSNPGGSPQRPAPRRDESDKKKKAEPEKVSANARVAQELARRHGVEVTGFDAPGVDEHTVREIAAAIDDVLPKYPQIDLRAVAVADTEPGIWSRVEDGREPDGRRYAARLVFSRLAACDPRAFAETISAQTASGHLVRGSDERPVYACVLRELGGALDIAGDFGARGLAQRELIGEYWQLLEPARRHDLLGRLVGGYKVWRSQMSGRCFDGLQLAPAQALSEAFTEVELHAEGAVGVARTLWRLLVEQARNAGGPGLPGDVQADSDR